MKYFWKIFSIILLYFIVIYNIIGIESQSPFFNSSLFSTNFLCGLITNPFSLFLTTFSFLFILLIFQKTLISNPINVARTTFLKILISLFLIFSFLILIRLFGATLKSLVYDSEYNVFISDFSNYNLFGIIFIANILATGYFFSLLIFAVSKTLYSFFITRISTIKYIFITLIVVFILQYLFDLFSPLNEFPIAYKYFTIVLFILLPVYFLEFKKNIFSFLTLLFWASIISTLVLHEHSQAENYKKFNAWANKIAKPNRFYIEDLINSEIDNFISIYKDTSSITEKKAFEFWTNSSFPHEVVGSQIYIEKENELLSEFNYNFKEDQIDKLIANEFDYQLLFIERDFEIEQTKYKIIVVADLTPQNLFQNISPEFINHSILTSDKIIDFSAVDLMILNNDKQIFITDNFPYLDKSQISNSKQELYSNGEKYSSVIISKNDIKEKLIFLKRSPSFIQTTFEIIKVLFIHLLILLILYIFVEISKKTGKRYLLSFRFVLLSSVILISLIPLLLLTIYFRDLTEEKNISAIKYKLHKRANQIENYFNHNQFSDENIDSLIQKANTDLNIHFSIFEDGKLFSSTYPTYYINGIIDTNINPIVFSVKDFEKSQRVYNIEIYGQPFYAFFSNLSLNEKYYTIEINTAFNPISVPISGNELDITLISSYFIAGVLIVLLTTILINRITKPIKLLTDGTKRIASGDFEIRVDSNAFGEIKELTNSFNSMSEQLNIAQKHIIQMEREATWKEMARQVAHEIKNPLTPMKLSIQQLIAMKKDESGNFNSTFDKITKTLLNQIATLGKIADEFSTFAKMPKINLSEVNLVSVIKNTFELYQDIGFSLNAFSEQISISSDKDYLSRVFINLIKNAKESNSTQIDFNISENEDKIEILIINNGDEIPTEIKHNIFEQTFSTKEKGMGLGLYLSKQFLNQTNADIELVSSNSELTKFKVSIKI